MLLLQAHKRMTLKVWLEGSKELVWQLPSLVTPNRTGASSTES